MRTIFVHSLFLVLLLFSACNEATSIDHEAEEVYGLHSIAYLKSYATSDARRIEASLVVEGVVTSTDRLGEFERELIIEDESGGIGIAIESAELYRRYPIGSRLQIYCNGLTLYNFGGRIELGNERDAYLRHGIRPENLERYIRLLNPAERDPVPTVKQLTEIAPNDVGRYVRFDRVHFTEQGLWCNEDAEELPIATEHPIQDDRGNPFLVRTLPTCHYAKEPLPVGRGSLYGIIDYFNGRYTLRVVNYGALFE